MRTLFQKLKLILTLRCGQASQLMSDSYERELQPHERAALRGHKLSCGNCCQLDRDLKVVVSASRHHNNDGVDHHGENREDQELSVAARERIKNQIRSASTAGDPPV